jgi:hypothetical protein
MKRNKKLTEELHCQISEDLSNRVSSFLKQWHDGDTSVFKTDDKDERIATRTYLLCVLLNEAVEHFVMYHIAAHEKDPQDALDILGDFIANVPLDHITTFSAFKLAELRAELRAKERARADELVAEAAHSTLQ